MLKEYTKEHRIAKMKDNQLYILNDNTYHKNRAKEIINKSG